MGFCFEADGFFSIEVYEACVVVEGGEDEAWFGGEDFFARFFDVGFEEGFDGFCAGGGGVCDGGCEDAVFAVFAPCLGDDF